MGEPKNKHDIETINSTLTDIVSTLQNESLIIYDIDGGDFTSSPSENIIDGGVF